MFFRKTELGAASSYARGRPSKRADGSGKACAHPESAEPSYGLASPPVPSFRLMTAAASVSVCA